MYLARLQKQFNSKVMLTSSFPFQIMSAVSCRQNLPDLIEKMPDGQVRDLELKFINGKERLVILSYQACYPMSTKRTSQSYQQTLTVAMTKVIACADINFFLFPTSSLLFSRDNRIPTGDGIFIVGSLKNAGLRPELEHDVIAGLEVDSLNKVKFFTRLQVRKNNPFQSLQTCLCAELLYNYLQRWQPP